MGDSQQSPHRPKEKLIPNPKARLREQIHEVMRFHHYSSRTKVTYWQWLVRVLKCQRCNTNYVS